MAKVEVYCKVTKKIRRIEKKYADILVKMKRASYDYETKVMKPSFDKVAEAPKIEAPIVADDEVIESIATDRAIEELIEVSEEIAAPKKRKRKKKKAE